MLNVDRVWARNAHKYPGKKLSDFRFLVNGQNWTLGPSILSGLTRVDFAAGSLILGITAAATITGSAETVPLRDWKQAFSAQVDYPNSEALTTGNRLLAGALFGEATSCDMPAKEIFIEVNGSLSYTIENLTTSILVVTIAHHCLVPRGVQ